jgi:hypothetical protein
VSLGFRSPLTLTIVRSSSGPTVFLQVLCKKANWINTYNIYDTAAPFGGYKQSGFGREMSAHALEHYTQIKSVCVDLNQQPEPCRATLSR